MCGSRRPSNGDFCTLGHFYNFVKMGLLFCVSWCKGRRLFFDGLPMLATDMVVTLPVFGCVNCLYCNSFSVSFRHDATNGALTPARLAISLSLHFPHSASLSNVITARRQHRPLTFVQVSAMEINAHLKRLQVRNDGSIKAGSPAPISAHTAPFPGTCSRPTPLQ